MSPPTGVLGNLDLQNIISNLAQLVTPITLLVLAISFVSGIIFIFKGIAMLHHLGASQNQMSQPKGVAGPFIYLGIGAILLYMPAATNIFSNTILGTSISYLFPNDDVIDIEGGNGANTFTYSVNVTPSYDQNASSELMQYVNFGIDQEWSSLINTIVMYIQLVGFIAFVRGWFILSGSANPGGAQQGAFSKGLTHIIGGIVAVNFVPFMQIIGKIIFT